jgi:hypothetical protein
VKSRDLSIVVVAEDAQGRSVGGALQRMALSRVSAADSLAEAGRACTTGAADACVVVLRNALFSEVAVDPVEPDAPGRGNGVPSLLLADVVTPYIRRFARRAGYAAVLPLCSPAALLRRGVRGLLQRARRPGRLILIGRGQSLSDDAVRRAAVAWKAARNDMPKRKLS